MDARTTRAARHDCAQLGRLNRPRSSSCGPAHQEKFFLLFFRNHVLLRVTRLEQRDERVVTIVEVGCDGRGGCAGRAQAGTDGEVVWSWPLEAEVCARAKARCREMGARTPIPRESTKDTVKPIARGRPGLSGCTRGTCRLHSFEQAGHGPQPRSGLLRALSLSGGTSSMHHPGTPCRGKARSCLVSCGRCNQVLNCRPGLAPGPITPGRCLRRDGGPVSPSHVGRWLWVPARGRDDTECDARSGAP